MSASTQETDPSISNFISILKAASEDYKKLTNENLDEHPFAAKLISCSSPADILDVFRIQAEAFEEFRKGDERLIKWLDPIVNILTKFSATVAAGNALIPANVIFTAITVLLVTAKDVVASHDALVNLFETIQLFLRRLDIYTRIQLPIEMIDLLGKIMGQVLYILALSTKEMKPQPQGRLKKFLKMLVGRNDIENALQKLGKLTQEETQLVTAKNLELAQVVKEAMDRLTRNHSRKTLQAWLSPPNPSINYNTARDTYHKDTGTWFIQGEKFQEWKTTLNGSLFWIRGNPGSGKSILCSAVIEDIKRMREAKSALMAYYYFDFKDATKRDIRGLLSSLLHQLSSDCDRSWDVLSQFHTKCRDGDDQPSEDALAQCLKDMLKLPGQLPVYIILDALDECPNTTGSPSAREKVLDLVADLVKSQHPNLYLCTMSRPEQDIQDILDPLTSTSRRVSLHEEVGQGEDILRYVRSFVYTNKNMRRWRVEDKELVINTLAERAGGMFRWVYCQLDTLSRCMPASIRRALDELPISLDETYARTLQDIHEEKWEYAHRLFQCLVAAVRPLRVEELAEIFAIQLDSDAETTYKIEESLRPDNAEDAVLSACSTLITIVSDEDSKIVQFSHFSVKEFLTSNRLTTTNDANTSRYHIGLEAAHTVLAKACLAELLQLDDEVDKERLGTFPLAFYAAEHWVDHAKFEKVASLIGDGMERLFDPTKAHFAVWVWIFDIDHPRRRSMEGLLERPLQPLATPLYYAALCGFKGLAEHLIVAHSQDVNAHGGFRNFPLVVAVRERHFSVACLLYGHRADVTVRSYSDSTPLHMAAGNGDLESMQFLLDRGADVNARNHFGGNPLWHAFYIERRDAMQLLLEHGADVDSQNHYSWSISHHASSNGNLEVVRLLLQHRANVNARDFENRRPLHRASLKGHANVAQLLIENGADVDAQDRYRCTSLFLASSEGQLEVVRVLLRHGADVHVRGEGNWTPLQLASAEGHDEIVQLLLEHGVEVEQEDSSIPSD